ncbi:RecQ family ATP-dependent DNA helicase [Herbiconiux sp. SYSU D00978]|uniref:RecQ family ATP-dependent DNA helicase n=1 Tax=Herbiconiux sp. SYSU D00978 TaxID=2812562 RepID=UPI0027DC3B42|nr:RecQ family ATP-dependent DNA helicase [Herbiconiux sp. SYSU D00978]
MPSRIERTARDAFGFESLRPGQHEAISALADGHDTLAVMPTGHGKSAIYQVAGLLLNGPTVVVSPLIALQHDQAGMIEEAPNAPDAVIINSSLSSGEIEEAWKDLGRKEAEYVFLAPEQLAKEEVVDRLRALKPRLFVVDEAHCVSSWGHDFRPDYLRLGEVIEDLGHPVVLALTATGSAPVREEIVERLNMKNPLVRTHGFDRPNLHLAVARHESDRAKREAVLDAVVAAGKPGLLYVATRRDTTKYAEELTKRGLRAAAYHGGLKAGERSEVHDAWLAGDLEVVVATSAFGMGIDKPDVRFVIHAAITESVDAYYQEIGRAGRDGEPSSIELHYRAEDLGLRSFFNSGAPDAAELARVFEAVASGAQRVGAVAEQTGLNQRRVSGLLNLLEEAGAVELGSKGAMVATDREGAEAAAQALEAAESRERIEQSRLAMIRAYAETRGCRRQFLLGYFGEGLPEPCGNCDNCDSGSAYDEQDETSDSAFRLEQRVVHPQWGEGMVMRLEEDRVTVFFEEEGYKVLALEAIEKNDLLQPAP